MFHWNCRISLSLPLYNQKDGSSFVELSQIPLSSLTMDRHSIRGRGNEAGEGGGVGIGLETGTNFGWDPKRWFRYFCFRVSKGAKREKSGENCFYWLINWFYEILPNLQICYTWFFIFHFLDLAERLLKENQKIPTVLNECERNATGPLMTKIMKCRRKNRSLRKRKM